MQHALEGWEDRVTRPSEQHVVKTAVDSKWNILRYKVLETNYSHFFLSFLIIALNLLLKYVYFLNLVTLSSLFTTDI